MFSFCCLFSRVKKLAMWYLRWPNSGAENAQCGLSSRPRATRLADLTGIDQPHRGANKKPKIPSSKKYPTVWNSFWERVACFLKVEKNNKNRLKPLIYSDDINAASSTTQRTVPAAQRFLESRREETAVGLCCELCLSHCSLEGKCIIKQHTHSRAIHFKGIFIKQLCLHQRCYISNK